jgi:hypothetical protein
MRINTVFARRFVILAIVKALQGERLIFPGLSRYADRG